MDKTATVRVLTMVAQGLDNGMSKEAGWWDNLKQWTKDKIEDPTGGRTESREDRVQNIKQMRNNASNYIKPAFSSPVIFATPFTEEQEKRVTQNYNDRMNKLYTAATFARGNTPYVKGVSGNYFIPLTGYKYK